jgi:hypothetical protein
MAETNFTIGCDPEFCITNKEEGSVLSAEDYYERNCIGSDGGGVAFEVRPDYSTDPLRVVSNMHNNLLQLVRKEVDFGDPEYVWQAGSFIATIEQPLGGHIHFGSIDSELTIPCACEWLDQYVGAASILIEDKEEGIARRERDYGYKGDHRVNDHGFEYRTPSSWITSPYIAAAILCLAKTVIHEALKLGGKKPTIRINNRHIAGMQVTTVRNKFMADIWPEITKMELYQDYKPQIDIIYMLVKNKRKWYPRTDMKTSWGIINLDKAQQPENPNIKLDTIWQQVKNKKNL